MTHIYKVSGMTCIGCRTKVQQLLENIEGVTKVEINLEQGEASISMDKHLDTNILRTALKEYPKYELTEKEVVGKSISTQDVEGAPKSWLETYRPILIVFAYIIGISLLLQFINHSFNWMQWMTHFMAGFFIVFSFFKMLNLKGFAESYSMYDIIAIRFKQWGYIYAFIELGLGISYLTGFNPFLTNLITLGIMSISIIGVLQSVLNKKKIKCACLGDIFNLPMSSITIIEDALMILMAFAMVI